MPRFAVHRTAMRRKELSRPLRLAIEADMVPEACSVMDYGCGCGDDLRRLRKKGYDAVGWDPTFKPAGPRRPSDVVNLGYVLNVIESGPERARVLTEAWALAKKAMVVSALITVDMRSNVVPFADGTVSVHGTFQKYYDQKELENFIRSTLQVEPVALGPGVFAIVRDATERAELRASRFRSRSRPLHGADARALLKENEAALLPIVAFVERHGRLPADVEKKGFAAAVERFGSFGRAARIVRDTTPTEDWENAARRVKDDLLVFLALTRFSDSPRFADLGVGMQADIKAHFGSFRKATDLADQALFAIGRPESIRAAVREAPFGKKMPAFFYFHADGLDALPIDLRLYEGCARMYLGRVQGANIIKLGLRERTVSYLHYPDFDSQGHPALSESLSVDLQTFRTHWAGFADRENPPILHRKELFVPIDYPDRQKFVRLTSQEERWELYDGVSGAIGTRDDWERRLRLAGVEIRGHRLVRLRS